MIAPNSFQPASGDPFPLRMLHLEARLPLGSTDVSRDPDFKFITDPAGSMRMSHVDATSHTISDRYEGTSEGIRELGNVPFEPLGCWGKRQPSPYRQQFQNTFINSALGANVTVTVLFEQFRATDAQSIPYKSGGACWSTITPYSGGLT